MKKLLNVIIILAVGIYVNAQILTVPTQYTQRQDSNYWGGNIPYNLQQWQLAGWIGYSSTTNDETSYFIIKDGFGAENPILNEIEGVGGDITGMQFYFKVTDSSFFADTVPSYIGGNTKSIFAKDSLPQKTWGEYYDENVEIYYNTFNSQYVVAANDDGGNNLSLSIVIDVRGDYSTVSGYFTPKGKNDITPSNLIPRKNWPYNP